VKTGEGSRQWARSRGPASGVVGDRGVATRDAIHLESYDQRDQTQVYTQSVVVGEEEGVEAFFGQLWAVPRPRAARVSLFHPNLCWIRRDLWESKEFQASDCFPVKRSDVLRSDPKQGTFVRDFWGRNGQRSFREVVLADMAGRGNRGRGRGRGSRGVNQWDDRGGRLEEEQWNGGQGWWNPGFPQPFPPPQFPPQYGFFPAQPPFPFNGPGPGQMQFQMNQGRNFHQQEPRLLLMDWISLFQSSEDSMQIEQSELAQYSCSRLLREMEAAEVDS
jgi:hypothetical protein